MDKRWECSIALIITARTQKEAEEKLDHFIRFPNEEILSKDDCEWEEMDD